VKTVELDGRKLKILQAIIDDYIATAVPIGSRTISKKHDIGFSSATIRNEMSDLEERGFLDQPHTSAGRIPSNKAYRLYVDNMIKSMPLSRKEIETIQSYFNVRMGEVETIVQNAAKALSDLTNYTSMALAPKHETIVFKHIQLIPIVDGKVLMIAVTNVGVLKDIVLRVPSDITPDVLESISRMLTIAMKERSWGELKSVLYDQLKGNISEHRAFMDEILSSLEYSLRGDQQPDVLLAGTRNIFNHPEYSDIQKARTFFELIEEKDAIVSVLTKASDIGFSVRIGEENEIKELKDCSVITAVYRIGDESIGTLGVIGPTRMNYQRVISVLQYIGNSLSFILRDL
jgi:heat-inducible transcriptional repressor